MASLYGIFDRTAMDVERLLNLGKRKEAKALLLRELSEGSAGPILQKLAAKVFGAQPGRQSTGLYRWFEIGEENDHLRDQGMSHSQRLQNLSEKYGRGTDHVEKCITEYDAARAASDAIARENDQP